MKKSNIFVVTGKSGTGKDSLVNAFFMGPKFGLVIKPKIEKIVPYTTRPSRSLKEQTSGDCVFIDDYHLDKLVNHAEFSEVRTYKIVNPDANSSAVLMDVHYATIINTIERGTNYLVIGQIETYSALIEKYKEDDSVIVHLIEIKNSPKIRLSRLLERETSSSNPNYRELCRRFSDDEDRFKDVPSEIIKVPLEKRKYSVIVNNGEFIDAFEQFAKYIIESAKEGAS